MVANGKKHAKDRKTPVSNLISYVSYTSLDVTSFCKVVSAELAKNPTPS